MTICSSIGGSGNLGFGIISNLLALLSVLLVILLFLDLDFVFVLDIIPSLVYNTGIYPRTCFPQSGISIVMFVKRFLKQQQII